MSATPLSLAVARAGAHVDLRKSESKRDTPCEACQPAVAAILANLDPLDLLSEEQRAALDIGAIVVEIAQARARSTENVLDVLRAALSEPRA